MEEREGDDAAKEGHRFSNIDIRGNAHLGNTYSGVVSSFQVPVLLTESEPLQSAWDTYRDALFLTDPIVDRETLRTEKGQRTEGTCEWIRGNAAYKSWLAGETPKLWISGGPGKGKTMLSMFLTEELEAYTQEAEGTSLLFYFCTHRYEEKSNAAAVFRSLAHQLLTKRPEMAPLISSYFKSEKITNTTLASAETIWIVLRTLLQAPEAGMVFCVLDGLDECDSASCNLIISKFSHFFATDRSGLSNRCFALCIVSRPMPGLQTYTQLKLNPDNDEYVDGDIRKFITFSVLHLQAPGLNEDLRKIITSTLLRRAQGTFLWVGLVMHELSRKMTCTEIIETLNALPSSLPGIYSRMLRQVEVNRRSMVSVILRWVTLTFKAMTLEQLAAVVGIRASCPLGIEQTIRDYITLCGPILQVTGNVVTLVHQSAIDYLLQEEVGDDPALALFRIRKQEAHARLTMIFLSYIERTFPHKMSPDEISEAMSKQVLLDYAVEFWPIHARHSGECLDWAALLKRDLLSEASIMWENWIVALESLSPGISYSIPGKCSAVIHVACNYGIVQLVHNLLSKGLDALGSQRLVAQKNAEGETALFSAIKGKSGDIVHLLLENDADINARNSEGETVLFEAVRWWSEGMVQFLLKRGADIEAKNVQGETALFGTILHESVNMMRFMLEQGADVHTTILDGVTPLMLVAYAGRIDMAGLMLKHRARINEKSRSGATALDYAIEGGCTAMTQFLLDEGANMDPKLAIRSIFPPHEKGLMAKATEMLKFLIQLGADVNGRKKNGNTLLIEQVFNGNVAAVELLLQHGANINARNSDNYTALQNFIIHGDRIMLQRLIQHGVDIDETDDDEVIRTIITRDNETMLRLLLQYGADINGIHDDDPSAVHIAFAYGSKASISLLLNWIVERSITVPHVSVQVQAGKANVKLDFPAESVLTSDTTNRYRVLEVARNDIGVQGTGNGLYTNKRKRREDETG